MCTLTTRFWEENSARECPPKDAEAREGSPTQVLRPNPAPLRVVVYGEGGTGTLALVSNGSIAPVPRTPTGAVGDHHRPMLR